MKTHTIYVDLTGGDQDKLTDRMKAVIKFVNNYKNPICILYEKHITPSVLFAKFMRKLQAKKVSDRVKIISINNYKDAMNRFCKSDNRAVFISAGDTREIVRQSVKVGRINKDFWPVLANTYPVADGHVVYGDLGAIAKEDIDIYDAIWIGLLLRQMSMTLYGKAVMALQNIGEEINKGGDRKEKLRQALKDYFQEDFFGNIEMHNLSKYNVNCLISNGIEANNTIKTFAGTQNDMYKKTKKGFLAPITKLAFKILYLLCWKELDWRIYSGAYLLGVKKPILITHGRCDKYGFYNGLKRAVDPMIWSIYDSINTNPEILQCKRTAI